jgi:hypothetical protein
MFSGIANSRIPLACVAAGLLWCGALALRPIEGSLPPGSGNASRVASGTGGVLGMVGGLRAAAAGLLWLRANLAWERRDAAATTALVELTVATDERPLHFWLNGARMMAYDLPAWRITEDQPAAVQRAFGRAGAGAALAFLERGRATHPDAADLTVEMAIIRLRRLDDREGAADLFRHAAGQPGAPYCAARIHAELLRELGRPEEALAWLEQVLPGLPADDPAAGRDVVLARIKALEAECGGR